MLPVHKNPLVYREWCIFCRPTRLWGWLIALSALMILGYFYISIEAVRQQDMRHVTISRNFALFVLAVQIFAGFYVSLGLTINSIVMERLRNTYELFVTLPISAADKVLGTSVGSTLLPMMVVLLLVPVSLVFGLAGGLAPAKLLWLYLLLSAGLLCFGLTGVAVSALLGKTRLAWVVVLIFFAFSMSFAGVAYGDDFTAVPLMVLSPYSIFAASTGNPSNLAAIFSRGGYHFYGLEVPWQVCPLVFYLFLAGVWFAAARRRLSRPAGRPLARLGLVGACLLFHVLLVGFLADSFRNSAWAGGPGCVEMTAAYFSFFFAITLVWALLSIPAYAGLMEWVQRPRWPVRLVSESFSDFRTPAFVPAAALWLAAVAAIVCIDALYWKDAPVPILHVRGLLMMMSIELLFIWAYQWLYLLGCLSFRKNGQVLGLVFVAAAMLVPLVFASIEGLEFLINATPFGIIAAEAPLFDGIRANADSWNAAYRSLIWAISLLALSALLGAIQFRRMLGISPRGRRLGTT